ncbi:integral membrane sensor signal transduction histidine kinase [Ectopseudomonas mendocina DLHK]|nr:HAMP domain-containing sensor histidine kinase [Pseudomonas sp.]EJO94138.1 integral membrane sensor signal transduction histidine kinase [Pseudomonas mendocina DLHK]MBA4246145.1 signal transduction histidine-protein kinase/phosphatase UhpB [Pseudomonas sp.]
MTALGRINLGVSLLFALVTLLGLALLLRQASEDVRRELLAAEAVVEYLGEVARTRPASLRPELTDNLRHIRVSWLRPGEDIHAQPGTGLQRWIARQLLDPSLLAADVWPLGDGRELRIALDPYDEIEEIQDSLLQLLLLSAFALALSLLTIRFAVRRGLRVLDELLAGLRQVGAGHFDTRLPNHGLAEAQRLAGHFNAMATTLQQVQADNAELTQALLELQERERARLGQALHDDLGQYLSGIRAQACLLRVIADRPQQVQDTACLLDDNCERLQQSFRSLIRDLYPVVLERLELGPALQQLAADWQQAQGIRCRLQLGERLPELPLASKAHLYRLVQEALTNVARHADASEVRIRLQRRGQGLRLLVRDNGQGTALPLRPGIGLRSMRERSRSLGGELRLHSRPQAGWALCLNIPLEATS